MIRKEIRAEAGYCVVESDGVRRVFATAAPSRGVTLPEQAQSALQTIQTLFREEGVSQPAVMQSVFLRNIEDQAACQKTVETFYGHELPATSYVPQPPCDGKLLAVEALGVERGRSEVEIERFGEQFVIARHDGIAWVHCAQVTPQTPSANVYDAATNVFQQMSALFGRAGVRFGQVIRTWLYLGEIVDEEGPTQRYKELNRARTDFYRDIAFRAGRLPPDGVQRGYPASTGIGTEGRGIMMSAVALATGRDDVVAVPLENPRQTAAYDYSDHYSPKSPKFSRAVALSCGGQATVFVSGTASITGAETRHVGDVAAQTHETLDNIAALISEENLCRHGLPGLGTSLDGLGLVRVYIKRQADYARTRAVCEERLGALPAIYVVADVCRPELLVEIEGIALSG